MTYMLIVPFTDLADERPRVATKFFEAASEAAATQHTEDMAGDAPLLMDLAVCDWRDEEEWAGLTGHGLLREAGYAFGAVELWREGQLLYVAETDLGPCGLERHRGPDGYDTPPSPTPPAST